MITKVFVVQHAMQRFRERGIKYSDVINCIIVGEIIEQYQMITLLQAALFFRY